MTVDGATGFAPTPASANAATRLPALRARLKQAQARWRLGSVLEGMVFSLVAALALLCGFQVFALYFDHAAPTASLAALSGHPLYALAFSVAVFACALALAIILALLLTPDLATFARKADRAFALQERLSTALEVDAAMRPDTDLDPVRCALLADAEWCAAVIDPRQMVKFALPRTAWVVPALLVVVVLLQLVPPGSFGLAAPRSPVSGTERDGTDFVGPPGVETAANLRRIVDLLNKDADQRSDPYLRTIARTLEHLSSELERSAIDRRSLANELGRLLQHTERAYAQGEGPGNRPPDRSGTVQDPARLLKSELDDITGNRQFGTAMPRDSNRANQAQDDAVAAREQLGRAPPAPERKTVGGRASDPSASSRQPAGRLDALKDRDDYDPVDPRIEIERAFAAQQRRERAASQSAGAAQDAGRGDGDRAGEGTRPLGNDVSAGSTALAPGVELLLPDQSANEGRRIRIELPPEAVLSGVAPPTAGNTGEWRRAQEQAVERSALAAEDRKVVGRYFMRSVEGHGP